MCREEQPMTIQRAYKTELDPNETQLKAFYGHSGAVRWIYNWMLARKDRYFRLFGQHAEKGDRHLSTPRLRKHLRARKHEHYPWLLQYSSRVEDTAAKMIDASFKLYFDVCSGKRSLPAGAKRRKDGKPAGFPRYKSRSRGPCAFKFWGIPPEHIEPKRIRLPMIGWVRIKERAYLPAQTIMSATVSERAGRWYISLQVDEPADIDRATGAPIGVDLGCSRLAVASDGREWDAPRSYRNAQKKLARLQRKADRQDKARPGHKPSNRWRDTQKQIARLSREIADIRKHAIHEMTSAIVGVGKPAHLRPAAIGIEDLNVAGMQKNGKLAISIADAAMGEIRRQLEYKAAWYGVTIVVASQWYPSSKTCSGCGCVKSELSLSERTFTCRECGMVIDRDLNAAINLQHLASKTGESLNAHGGDGSGVDSWIVDVKPAPVKCEAAI